MALTRIKSSNIADETVVAEDIADGSVTDAKIQTGISSSKLTGNLPAISGASLTNLTAANRKIIVAVATAQPITGCTVAGVTAIQIVASTGGDDMDTTIYVASVPTGTSGTIIITMSGSAGELHTRGGIGVYAAYGISSTASDTFTTTSTTDPMSQTIDIPAGGVAVAITHMNKGPGIPALTWTGFTEDYELTTANSSQTAGGGSKTSSSAVTVTVGVDSDIGINNNGFVGASFASDGSNAGSGKITRIHGTSLAWS